MESLNSSHLAVACKKAKIQVKLQKEVKSTQEKPNCKKRCGPCKKAAWKKLWNQRWKLRSSCGGLIMAKFLITTIQANFGPVGGGYTNSPELLLLKILPLSDHHSHFWAATFDFTTFSCCFFLHGPHLFLQFGCFCVDLNNLGIKIFPLEYLQMYTCRWPPLFLTMTPQKTNFSLCFIIANYCSNCNHACTV